MGENSDSDSWLGDPRLDYDLGSKTQPVLLPCSLPGYEYQLDPYMGCEHQCLYCYALCSQNGGWMNEVRSYKNLSERLADQVSQLNPQPIYVGWFSDPYQPIESEQCQTRESLQVLLDAGFSACILTKSDLVVRDIHLLLRMPDVSVGISLGFSDDSLRCLLELGTPPNHSRIKALQTLKEAGIGTYALICPILPFLTDIPMLLKSLHGYVESVWFYPISIQQEAGRNWQNIWGVVNEKYPDLAKNFKAAVFNLNHEYWQKQRTLMEEWAKESDVELLVNF